MTENEFEAFQQKKGSCFSVLSERVFEFLSKKGNVFTELFSKNVSPFDFLWKINETKGKFSSTNVVKEAIEGWSLKQCLKIMVKSEILIFCMHFLINSVHGVLSLISATTKGMKKFLDSVSIDEKHVTEIYCFPWNFGMVCNTQRFWRITSMMITIIEKESYHLIGWFVFYRNKCTAF